MTAVTSGCGSLIAYCKCGRIAHNCASYDAIRVKINTDPIRILLKANENSQIVSTCCRVAVTDPGSAKHGGNNQARSLELSPPCFNPCGTSRAAPEEMNNRSARLQLSHRGRVSRSHTSSLPRLLHEQPWTQRARKGKKRENLSRCGISSSEVDTVPCTETSWNSSQRAG